MTKLDTTPTVDVRSLLRDNVTAVIAVFDAHDPGKEYPNPIGMKVTGPATFVCPRKCGFRGPEAEWEQHLADKLADLLTGEGA